MAFNGATNCTDNGAWRPTHRYVAMWVVLLLVTRVTGEWVEISQHQRRGEPLRRPPGYHGATEQNKIYANYTLAERTWQRNGPRITNIGSVRRVQLRGKDKVPFSVGESSDSTVTTSDREYGSVGSVRAPNLNIKQVIDTDKLKRKSNVNQLGTENTINVRIQNPTRHPYLLIEKTILKSPEILNVSKDIIEKNKYQEIIIPDEKFDESETNYKTANVNLNMKPVRSNSNVGIWSGEQSFGNPFVNLNQYLEDNVNKNKNNNGNKSRTNNVTYKTANNYFLENEKSPAHGQFPTAPTVEQTLEKNFNKDVERKTKIENVTDIPKGQQRTKSKSEINIDAKLAERKDINSDTKANTMEVIWKLMKLVTDNISRNTRRSFRSKIRYLENLQNTIVANIAERLELAWPDDVTAVGARRRRGVAATEARGHGHVEFPSSESALMTISFLTFAVFLIKLVLQVIHTYKNKTMMVSPAVVAAVGRVTSPLRK